MNTPIIIENLEIFPKDFGLINWEQANHNAKTLGQGWRIPTLKEMTDILYPNREELSSIWESVSICWTADPAYYVGHYRTFSLSDGKRNDFHFTTLVNAILVRDFNGETAISYLLKEF
jgi:hypothetical protein